MNENDYARFVSLGHLKVALEGLDAARILLESIGHPHGSTLRPAVRIVAAVEEALSSELPGEDPLTQ